MIVTELFMVRRDGTRLFRKYSDEDRYLIREDGIVFEEAVDVEGSEHKYTEGEIIREE